jgi:hypothetical protein
MCSELTYLDMTGCPNLDDAALLAITSGCLSLQSLLLADCWKATAASISSVCKNAQICGFCLDLNLFSLQISRLTALQTLHLTLLPVDDATLRTIASSCSSLTSLDLSACSSLGQDSIFILGRYVGERLKVLRLDGCGGCRNFFELKNCPNLEIFSAAGCAISTWDLCETLPLMSKLSQVGLESAWDVKNAALVSLGASNSSKSLTKLDLSSCSGFDDIGVEAVVENAINLEELNLRFCSGISDSLIFKMASLNLRKLRWIDLSECSKISADAVSALVGSAPVLSYINLKGCAKIMKKHLESIQKNNTLTTIVWG